MSKEIILPFGKYKGMKLSKVPLRYLGWLLTKYEGYRISKEDIELEAKRRGCYKKNGCWGIDKINIPKQEWKYLYGKVEYQRDFLGNYITRTIKDDIEMGDDIYDYEGIPNMY